MNALKTCCFSITNGSSKDRSLTCKTVSVHLSSRMLGPQYYKYITLKAFFKKKFTLEYRASSKLVLCSPKIILNKINLKISQSCCLASAVFLVIKTMKI